MSGCLITGIRLFHGRAPKMVFRIISILVAVLSFEALLFNCRTVSIKAKETERDHVVLSGLQRRFADNSQEVNENSTPHEVTEFPLNIRSLEGLISELIADVEQLFNETEMLNDLMEEQTNFIDVIALQVARLNSQFLADGCGGVLDPTEFGLIRYKENEDYDFNENCVWIIDLPGATRIKFKLEKGGFHKYYDFLTIASLIDSGGVLERHKLRVQQQSCIVTGARATVTFTSNSWRTGKGFRLSYQKLSDLDSSLEILEDKCGGVIVGKTGNLNYKSRKDYSNNEWCVWILHSPESRSIQLDLTEDGFRICCDFLVVNTIDAETGAIRNDRRIFNARNWTQTIQSSLIVIMFHSNADDMQGQGFSLRFRSYGNEVNVKYKYNLRHITGSIGTAEYPREQYMWTGGIRGERNIFLIAFSWVPTTDKFVTTINWKVQHRNDSYTHDSFNIYEPAVTVSDLFTELPTIWLKTEQITNGRFGPDANTITTEYNDSAYTTFTLKARAIIIVYKPMLDDRNGTETRFKLEYSRAHKSSTCGGLLEPLKSESGLISYKENEIYDKEEFCMWTIEVPGAERIGFYLERNGLAPCCDTDILLIPIDVAGYTVGTIARLGFNRVIDSVMGPLARVRFTSDDLEIGSGFRLRYEGIVDYECGGIVNSSDGEFGMIKYKDYSKYASNENCVWLIEAQNTSSIGFTLEQSEFQKCCDYITVISTEPNGTQSGPAYKLRYSGQQATAKGPKVMVRFSSDGSAEGKGFRLRFEKNPDWETSSEGDKCGGVIVKAKGLLHFKPGKEYIRFQQCVWLLYSPNRTSITLTLLQGMRRYWGSLYIRTIDPKTGTLSTYRERFGNLALTVKSSMVVIVFKAGDGGVGFTLMYSSTGSKSDLEDQYKLCHISDLYGKFEYPNSIWDRPVSGKKETFVIARSLNLKEEKESTSLLKLSWKSGVFKKAHKYCEYGSVTIYVTTGSSDWSNLEQFPNENDTSSCSDIVTVAAKKIATIKNSMFLVVFKPLALDKESKKEGNTSFSFTYEIGICGGVYAGNSGIIWYNDHEEDRNNEQCVWLVDVPRAESISFTVEFGKLKRVDEYLTISSVEPFTGVQGKATVLSAKAPSASVKGPVAIVIFSSDGSLVKSGFRLHFRMNIQMSDEPAFSYQLFHQNLRTQKQFVYNAVSNHVAIVAFSTGTTLPKGIQVDISSFQPQFNESCYSDSLLIFDVFGEVEETLVLTKKFTSADVGAERNQTEKYALSQTCILVMENQLLACENNKQCQNATNKCNFQTNSSSFLAIYSSINATDNMAYRGFSLTTQV